MRNDQMQNLSEEQLQDLLTRADNLYRELEELMAVDRRVTHATQRDRLLQNSADNLMLYTMGIRSLHMRKQLVGR